MTLCTVSRRVSGTCYPARTKRTINNLVTKGIFIFLLFIERRILHIIIINILALLGARRIVLRPSGKNSAARALRVIMNERTKRQQKERGALIAFAAALGRAFVATALHTKYANTINFAIAERKLLHETQSPHRESKRRSLSPSLPLSLGKPSLLRGDMRM